jgi:hypothetical protein
VRRLEDHLVARQRQLRLEQAPRLRFEEREQAKQLGRVRLLEVVGRLLDLVLVIDVAVGEDALLAVLVARRPHEVVHVVLALQVQRKPLEAVGDLAGDRVAVDPADLLEIGELRDLHAVQPYLPAQAPRAERGVLPVVLDEAYVVGCKVEAERGEGAEIALEDVRRRRLQHDLELVVVLQTIRVLAVTAVLRPARGLHVGRAPRLRPQRAQERGGVRRSGADFHVIGLQQGAPLPVPVLRQREDDLLERLHAASRAKGAILRVRPQWRCAPP